MYLLYRYITSVIQSFVYIQQDDLPKKKNIFFYSNENFNLLSTSFKINLICFLKYCSLLSILLLNISACVDSNYTIRLGVYFSKLHRTII